MISGCLEIGDGLLHNGHMYNLYILVQLPLVQQI
jgi:hypothetical protein